MKITLADTAPDAEAWGDLGYRAAWAAATAEDYAGDRFDDDLEASMDPWLFNELSAAPDGLPAPSPTNIDAGGEHRASAQGGERPDAGPTAPFEAIHGVEAVTRAARRASAAQDRLFATILEQAAADPDPWVGADPTLDPAWHDPRGWTVAAIREHRRSLAIRSAAADIGLRAHLSDNQVRNRAHRAHVLQSRCPALWNACLDGDVSEQNMAIAADVAASLPADAPTAWAAFDDAIAEAAASMVPGRFRLRARAVRERVHRESMRERHTRAAEKRYIDVSPEYDGMATLTALIPATQAHAIDAMVEQEARHLARLDGEPRTLAQLRVDVFTDLVLTTPPAAGVAPATDVASPSDGAPLAATTADPTRVRAIVRVTIPALTLLGHGDEPATLDGYGPIPLDEATKLAAGADHWIRVLTHPITSTVVDVDRRRYRVPADMRRMLNTLHPTCVFPGCNRPSHDCDYDHRRQWRAGGRTSIENGAPLHPRHHTLKDDTRWQLKRDPTNGRLHWISPSGYDAELDPAPF